MNDHKLIKFDSPFYYNDTMKINTVWLHVAGNFICEVSKPAKQWHGEWEL